MAASFSARAAITRFTLIEPGKRCLPSRVIGRSLNSSPKKFAKILKFLSREDRSLTHPSAGPRLACLRSRRAAEDQGSRQTEHQRKPVSALAARAEGGEGGGGRAVALVSESNGASVA